MGEGSLSQEEIDALLMGADETTAEAGVSEEPGSISMDLSSGLSDSEKNSLISPFSEALQAASTVAGSLVGKKISISNVRFEELGSSEVSSQIQIGSVVVAINMGAAISTIAFTEEQAKNIAMLMMGLDSLPEEIDEAHLSTIGELSNTLTSSMANKLTDKFGESLSPNVPETKIYSGIADLPSFPGENIAKLSFTFNIEGVISAQVSQYFDSTSVSRWASKAGGLANAAKDTASNFGMGAPMASSDRSMQTSKEQVPITPISFPSLGAGTGGQQAPQGNFELLLDVQMVLTVELGRTKKYVKDILGLGEGSIIELDKLAGEPVDLLVNQKLIAKGEVVVIDENFGVRVTDIVGPTERLAKINS
ncbi:MAG: flagellar motor switch protein FliN [Spirochaetia bacterium]|nr:flagellar motor switch protein FliN [Spirochaetia bacterium]